MGNESIFRKIFFHVQLALLTAACLLSSSRLFLYCAPKLDIGAEYRFRGIQLNNPTYSTEAPLGSGRTIDKKYYSHRARVYLKGKLDPGIEIGTVLQAIGLSGSTEPVLNRYPNESFNPFVENIYVQANEIADWPISATFGRQPYVWGSGLLVADDGLGFDGIRLDAGPFWGVRTHLFTAKTKDKIIGENNGDLYLAGMEYNFGIHKVLLGWMMENDQTGLPYFNLAGATIPLTSDKITRQFYDLQLSGRFEKGAFYNAEYAMQRGTVKFPGIDALGQPTTIDTALRGSVLTFEGGFDFTHPRYKRMILAFVFSQCSGDDPESTGEDEKFNPSFGHKYDGLERSGYGEFFAATPYSFFNEDRAQVIILRDPATGAILKSIPYTGLFSGLRIWGFRGSINPWEGAVAGLEFYLYNAREVIQREATATSAGSADKALGRELVIWAKYTYAKRVDLSLRWGKFFPNSLLNDVGSSRLIFEVSGKF